MDEEACGMNVDEGACGVLLGCCNLLGEGGINEDIFISYRILLMLCWTIVWCRSLNLCNFAATYLSNAEHSSFSELRTWTAVLIYFKA